MVVHNANIAVHTGLQFHPTNSTSPSTNMNPDNVEQINQSSGAVGLIGGLIGLAIVIFIIAGVWKVYTKAGQPGWACLVPIYQIIVLLQIVGKPLWWIVLMLIPFVNFIVAIIVLVELAKRFGKGAGFGIGLAFLGFIFFPILGFGDARYQGPAAA
jgi:hypothetical protein